MTEVKYYIQLDWKSFNVDLNTVDTWARSNAGPDYCGDNVGISSFQFCFINEPAQQYKDAVNTYWNGLTSSSPEATNYSSMADRKVTTAAAKASAITKLQALGLTDAEISALCG